MTLVLVRSAPPHRNGPKEYFSLQVSFYCVESKYILLTSNQPYKSRRSGNCSCDLFSQTHSLCDLGQIAEIFPSLCIVMSLNCFNNSTRFLSINNSTRKRRKNCRRDPGEFGGRTMLQSLIQHVWGRGWPAHVCLTSSWTPSLHNKHIYIANKIQCLATSSHSALSFSRPLLPWGKQKSVPSLTLCLLKAVKSLEPLSTHCS